MILRKFIEWIKGLTRTSVIKLDLRANEHIMLRRWDDKEFALVYQDLVFK